MRAVDLTVVTLPLVAELLPQVVDIPARMTTWRDESRFYQVLLPPAHERAAIDADRLGGDASWNKIAGHTVTITYESPSSGRCATVATLSYECNDYSMASESSTESDRPEPLIRGRRSYVPPDRRPAAPPTYPKAWMYPRPGETELERQARLQRSCAECGVFLADPYALTVHENGCEGPK